MKKSIILIVLLGSISLFSSCEIVEAVTTIDFPDLEDLGLRDRWKGWQHPCADKHCDAEFWIDTLVQPNTWVDENGYHHIEYRGPKYFTILAKLDQLADEYVINGVPLVGVGWDSDTFVAFDTIAFSVPMYNLLGLNDAWGNKISVGDLQISFSNLAGLHPPINIAGYQINKRTNLDRLGTSTLYSYNSKQQFYLNHTMIGDTLTCWGTAYFNIDVGPTDEISAEFKIIVDAYYDEG